MYRSSVEPPLRACATGQRSRSAAARESRHRLAHLGLPTDPVVPEPARPVGATGHSPIFFVSGERIDNSLGPL